MKADFDDIDAMIAEKWPNLEPAQARSLGSYLFQGWVFVDIGRDGEVNMVKGEGIAANYGYVRADGTFRPA